MERRRSNEILLGIIEALVNQRTWTQARLAQHLHIEVRALRSHLTDLEALGVQVDKDGRDIYISVPKDWLVGSGVNFSRDDVLQTVRLLLFAPATDERNATIGKLLSSLPTLRESLDLDSVTGPSAPGGSEHTSAIMDAISSTVLAMTYRSAEDTESQRLISPQRIFHEPPYLYAVAYCHERGALRLFRLDRIVRVAARKDVEFITMSREAIDEDLASRIDGYRDTTPPQTYHLHTTQAAATWVLDSLPPGASMETTADGVRITVRTAAPLQLARHIVSLGAAIRVETESLRKQALALAREAVKALEDD